MLRLATLEDARISPGSSTTRSSSKHFSRSAIARARTKSPPSCTPAANFWCWTTTEPGTRNVEPERPDGCVYLKCTGDRGYFGMLSIDPARQRQGLGRRLIDAAEARARERGCRFMDIHIVNLREELPAYYRRLGYVENGTLPFSDPDRASRPVSSSSCPSHSDAIGRLMDCNLDTNCEPERCVGHELSCHGRWFAISTGMRVRITRAPERCRRRHVPALLPCGRGLRRDA